MSKLVLKSEFAPAANDNKPWELTVETKTREDLIRLSVFLAGALPPDIQRSRWNPPIIVIDGTGAGGKSMIIEAMMKTLLDQADPLDMLKPGAADTMFIEAGPAEAISVYCYAAGSHEGAPVLYGFDRRSWHKMSLVKTFRKALAEVKPRPVGGAVFCSGSTLDDKAWLSFFLRRNYTGPLDGNLHYHRRQQKAPQQPEIPATLEPPAGNRRDRRSHASVRAGRTAAAEKRSCRRRPAKTF